MQRGFITYVDHNGLISVKPKRARNNFPIKGLLLLVIGFFGFKAFMLAAVGPVSYNERVAKLEGGTVIERAGAKALAIDPITTMIADFAGPIMRN